ncbi:MAG: glutamine amidotransferase family protein [Woeseia sp.]
MCGIVGIYHKNKALNPSLGASLASMLVQMSDRGPDSAGVAIYRDPVDDGYLKLSLYSAAECDWSEVRDRLQESFGKASGVEPRASHAILVAPVSNALIFAWLDEYYPALQVMSVGSAIEIYKEKGLPRDFVRHFRLESLAGTHALGHTRMATESAVTTEHSHPFSTGLDLCLVHNGSLSNHNRWRRRLCDEGIAFQTDNDSEVAAGYMTWRMQEGDSLHEALQHALEDLDGFYTFAIGTREGFAVVRDPIACKPAVMAETEDWVAMASEFRAIAQLPGVEQARIWEPEPATVYSWGS